MNDFRLEWYDEELGMRIQQHNWISPKGYYYRQYDREDGTSSIKFRISEKSFISAVEELVNA